MSALFIIECQSVTCMDDNVCQLIFVVINVLLAIVPHLFMFYSDINKDNDTIVKSTFD